MTRVLFLCTGNSARSQMAEAILRRLGGDRFDVHSAGIEPKGIHPLTVQVMAELGIDVSSQKSKGLAGYLEQPWDYVITVCDRAAESCPVFPSGGRRLHWSTPDPAAVDGSQDARLAAFRAARDALAERVRQFLREGEMMAGNRPGQRPITFPCGDLTLEGVVHTVAEEPHPGVVVCHPHPLYGGSMDNNVVLAVGDELAKAGIAALRFNFRSVGGSGGAYGAGLTETEDVGAALDALAAQPGIDTACLGLVGYSFGALVAASAAAADARVRALVLISPPTGRLDMQGLSAFAGPRLFIVGANDRFAVANDLGRRVASLPAPTEFRVIPDADHFWLAHTDELAEQVRGFFCRWLFPKPPSS